MIVCPSVMIVVGAVIPVGIVTAPPGLEITVCPLEFVVVDGAVGFHVMVTPDDVNVVRELPGGTSIVIVVSIMTTYLAIEHLVNSLNDYTYSLTIRLCRCNRCM